ncbi:MAG TPA: alpha/beta hydrolase [Gemmataceae bacterium]|nr:alpha/beta hydrolase [Gemmataceae bacterium]
MPRVTVNGWKFLYRQAGTGPDVVLLPGASRVASSRRLFDALVPDFRVTVYQPRIGPVNGVSSADVADDFHALRAKLGLGSCYVVAHGAASVAALHAAVLYPDSVAGIVLTEPRLPKARHETAAGTRSALTTRRIVLIDQPVFVLHPPESSALPLCHFLAAHLPRCKVALASEDPDQYVASIQEALRKLAAVFREVEVAGANRATTSGPRGLLARAWPDARDGRAISRWMARLSAWGF